MCTAVRMSMLIEIFSVHSIEQQTSKNSIIQPWAMLKKNIRYLVIPEWEEEKNHWDINTSQPNTVKNVKTLGVAIHSGSKWNKTSS